MAVTVIDLRILIADGDSITDWIGVDGLNTTNYAEASGCVASGLNIATGQLYYSGAPLSGGLDLTGQLVYVQSYTNALQNSWLEATLSDSSHGMWISDGTNNLVALQAGNDRDVFKHADTQVQYQSFVLDTDYASTKNTAGEVYMDAGSFASWNPASITQIGSRFVTLSKALGGGDNVFVDIMRYGNDGILVNGGTTGDRGIFLEIVELDRSRADTRAHGLIREYTAGAYGCQGTLQFGTASTLADAWFDDSNISLTFEDRDVNDDKFKLKVIANATDTNTFILANSQISSAGPGVKVDMSSNDIDTLTIDTVSFNSLLNDISFPTDTVTTEHQVINSTFNVCGQVDPGTVIFTNNTIASSTNPTGSVLLDADGTGNWQDLSFISDGTGHGIYITSPGTYSFIGILFSSFGASGSTDSSIYNDSGGHVEINISGGGDTPTYRNGTSATTTINNNILVTLTGLQLNTEVRIYNTGTQSELAGVEDSTATFSFSLQAGIVTDIIIHHIDYEYLRIDAFEIPSGDSTIPIQQRFDRNKI